MLSNDVISTCDQNLWPWNRSSRILLICYTQVIGYVQVFRPPRIIILWYGNNCISDNLLSIRVHLIFFKISSLFHPKIKFKFKTSFMSWIKFFKPCYKQGEEGGEGWWFWLAWIITKENQYLDLNLIIFLILFVSNVIKALISPYRIEFYFCLAWICYIYLCCNLNFHVNHNY